MKENLISTHFLETKHPSTIEFCQGIDVTKSKKEIAIELYYKVRDYFLYDPFHLDLREEALKSSTILKKKRAWCTEKAIVLATCARYFGIPSRLGYAIVVNHLGAEKLTQYLKRKEIVFHGYTSLYINEKWVKCTPAFDKNVCRISGVSPLNWDGEHDSLFQESTGNQRFMEYIHEYGTFDDVPIDLMKTEMKKYYPHLFINQIETKEFSFRY